MNPIDHILSDIKDPREREALEDLRHTLHELLPGAIECISYGIPTLKVGGKGVAGFARYKNHLSFFPFSGSIFEHFPEEMKDYEHTKSSLHFTPEKRIPREFLEKMIQKRMELHHSTHHMPTPSDIFAYESALSEPDRALCETLRYEIESSLPEATSKVWHGHPVWFLEANPIVGYAKLKDSIQLLFWSGQSFDESGLENTGKFQAAEKRYTHTEEIEKNDISRWLSKSRDIQWDYANIVKRNGKLERLR